MSSILGTHVKETKYLMKLFSVLQNASRNMQENTYTHTPIHTHPMHYYCAYNSDKYNLKPERNVQKHLRALAILTEPSSSRPCIWISLSNELGNVRRRYKFRVYYQYYDSLTYRYRSWNLEEASIESVRLKREAGVTEERQRGRHSRLLSDTLYRRDYLLSYSVKPSMTPFY